MSKQVYVLDCTLRDGGYCNKWMFGQDNIKKVIHGLVRSGTDYIECGFLTNRIEYNADATKFTEPSQVSQFLTSANSERPLLLMMNYGEYNAEDLPDCPDTCITGLRVAFHKKDWPDALRLCGSIKEKGYSVFIQPMVSMSYSDEEFLSLIQEVNVLMPSAFYIVDSFGAMSSSDLMRYSDLVDKNLSEEIPLGFHAHNNLQMAYSNARSLVESDFKRDIIVDVSIHGMGRGAGNLNSELFLDYLNTHKGKDYSIRCILNIMDEVIARFYEEKPWGYSLPNYLSATHMIHPNYATYISNKHTLTFEAIDSLFDMITPRKGLEYDESFIETLYVDYLSKQDLMDSSISNIASMIKGRKLLMLANGRSIITERKTIESFVYANNPLIIGINNDCDYLNTNLVFVSNMRRFKQLNPAIYNKTIITSNIQSTDTLARVEYNKYLSDIEGIRDNAGLMALQFFASLGVTEFYLAGFDGYSYNNYDNFENRDMVVFNSNEEIDSMNNKLSLALRALSDKYSITFVTSSKIPSSFPNEN